MKSEKILHLVIEGVDRSGKSTVCRVLSEKLNVPIIKMQDMPRHFKKNPEEASEIFNKTVSQFKDFSFICDRFYPSSLVYSKVYKRNYDLTYINEIEKILKPRVVVLYRALPRFPDKLISKQKYAKLVVEYITQAKLHKWKLIDVGDKTPNEIVKLILKYI